MARITNADEFNITTQVDDEGRKFLVTIEFAPEELPYYPVMVAAAIVARAPTTMYKALANGYHGLEGVLVDGVAHVTHASLVEYLRRREATGEARLAMKARKVKRMAKVPRQGRDGPRPPRVIVATQTAQELLDSGRLDFLNDIVSE